MAAAGYLCIIGAVFATYVLARKLDHIDAQVDETFGLETWMPEGAATLRAETGGDGHERGSAAYDGRTHHEAVDNS